MVRLSIFPCAVKRPSVLNSISPAAQASADEKCGLWQQKPAPMVPGGVAGAVEEYAVNSVFDVTNGYAVLRVLCGVFFIPHVVGKISARQASVGFFKLAGFNPPQFWSYAAMAIEIVLAVCLVFGILPVYAAYLGCIYLLIAAAANFRVSRKWLWHIGGSEWPVFWALCCAVVGYYGSH